MTRPTGGPRALALLAVAALSGCASWHRDMYGFNEPAKAEGGTSDAFVSVAVVEPLKAGSRPRWPPFEWTRLAAQNLHECGYAMTHSDSEAADDYGAYGYAYGAACALAFLPVTLVMAPVDVVAAPFRWDVKAKLSVDGTVTRSNGMPRGGAAVEGRLGYHERIGMIRFGGREPRLRAFTTTADAAGRFSLPIDVRFGSSRVDYLTLDLAVDGAFARRLVIAQDDDQFLSWRYDAAPDAAEPATKIKLP